MSIEHIRSCRRSLRPDASAPSAVGVLTATAIGVYAVVVAGVAVSVAGVADSGVALDASASGVTAAGIDSPATLLLVGHHLGAALVGLLLLSTTVRLWRSDLATRIAALATIGLLLYPIQAGIGARLAIVGPTPGFQYVHLVLGMGIFSALFVALLWTVERDVGIDDRPPDTTTRASQSTTTARDADRSISDDRSPAGGVRSSLGVRERIGAYVSITKPRLMWLLSLVALAGMALAAPSLWTLDPIVVMATLVGGALAIGASGTFNNVIERERDERMDRTDDRPLVNGDVSPIGATVFGILLATASIGVFLAFVNPLAMTLTLLAILCYSVGYTVVLKPNTAANVAVGGIVGAFPALIGWAAVTGSVGLPALLLGLIIVLWTPAHFYPLAIAYADDYAEAGIPMLPVVKGEPLTRRRVHGYAGATMIAVAGFLSLGPVEAIVAVTAVVVTGVFVVAIVRLHRIRNRSAAMRTFLASNLYLGAFLAAIVLEAAIA